MFIGLLSSIVSAPNHTKCVSLSNQKCMTLPTHINLHPNEYSKELHYYSFAVKLDRFVGSFNTLNELSINVCVPNKAEDLNLSMFNMITGTNELKILTKPISCECTCKFDGRKCNLNEKWNIDKYDASAKKHHICQKHYIWNPATCTCKNGKYLGSIIDNSVITCDKILDVEETKTIPKI